MQFEQDKLYHGTQPQDKGTFQIPDCIPLFPLPNVVLFPKTYLPLHIFEPRYQDMITDAGAQGQCVGMALLKEGWEERYYENPPIFQIGCVGRLVSTQRFSDGRSNILLQGLARYEICEELDGKNYRRANIVLKPHVEGPGPGTSLRAELTKALQEFVQTHEDPLLWQGFSPLEASDEVLVNALSTYLDFTPLEKQFLLEADSLQQRARRFQDLMQFKRHEQDGATGWV